MKNLLLLIPFLLVLFAFTGSDRFIIKEQFPFLIGRYKLIQVVESEGAKPRRDFPDSYELVIKQHDELILYKNSKRIKRLEFIDLRSPIETQENYVLFLDNQDNYPLYFYGDTIQQFYWPFGFSDNYFKKIE
jgi:hypothetical protein